VKQQTRERLIDMGVSGLTAYCAYPLLEPILGTWRSVILGAALGVLASEYMDHRRETRRARERNKL
jgi:hypothetical protein